LEQSEHSGTLEVWVTASRAQLPVEGATVAVTTAGPENRQLLALLVTNESGRAGPVTLASPSGGNMGLEPGGPAPFTDYSLWVEHPEYEVARIDRLQIFPGVDSVQQINLLPLSMPSWEGGSVDTETGSQPQDL